MPDPAAKPVAWITGGGRGLGRAIALAFGKRGYRVAVHYHASESDAAETVQQLTQMGSDAFSIQGDVRESPDAVRIAEAIRKRWGRLDVLVNNAGSVRNRTIAKMNDEDWREVLATHLNAPFYCTRAALPALRAAHGGSILNIVSFLAFRPARGAANYAAAKAGLVAFTQATAVEEGRHSVRANAFLPGFHVTDMNRDVWAKMEPEIRSQHLLPSLHDRDEMADFAATVAGLRSVTGQVFAFESRLLR